MCLRWREERRQRVRQHTGGGKRPTEGGSEERRQDLRDERTWRARTSGFGRSGAEKGVKQSSAWKERRLSDSHNYLCSSQFSPSPPTYLLSTSSQFLTLSFVHLSSSFSLSSYTRTRARACTRMHARTRRNDANRKRRRSEMWEVEKSGRSGNEKSQRRTAGELFNYLVYHCRDAVEEPSVAKPGVWEGSEGKHTQVTFLYLYGQRQDLLLRCVNFYL